MQYNLKISKLDHQNTKIVKSKIRTKSTIKLEEELTFEKSLMSIGTFRSMSDIQSILRNIQRDQNNRASSKRNRAAKTRTE